VETEIKLDAAEDQVLPGFEDLVTVARSSTTLRARYWDTGDRDLLRWGVTLRHRRATDGSEDVWTLKIGPGPDGGTSSRTELTSTASSDTPPAELLRLLRGVTANRQVGPIAEIITDRSVRRLGRDLWSAQVEVADDRVTSSVGGSPGPAFRQVEAELIDPRAVETLGSVVEILASSGLERSPYRSKLARVLGDETPAVTDERVLGSGASLEQSISALLCDHHERLVLADIRIRVSDDVEAVHRARTGTRRARSTLTTFRPYLRRSAVDHLMGELRWYGGLLGRVRDLDVMDERLRGLARDIGIGGVATSPAGSDELDEVLEILEGQRQVDRRQLLSAMDGERYLAMLDLLSDSARTPPLRRHVDGGRSAARVQRDRSRAEWKKVRRAHRRLDDGLTVDGLHALRKKVKGVQESARGAERIGLDAERLRRAAGALKDELGEHQDIIVLSRWLDDVQGRLGYRAAYLAGRARQRLDEHRRLLEESWPERWHDLDRGRNRRWM